MRTPQPWGVRGGAHVPFPDRGLQTLHTTGRLVPCPRARPTAAGGGEASEKGTHDTAAPGQHAIGMCAVSCVGGNLLYQPVFHVEVSVKGLVVVHHFPASDQKAVTLSHTNKDTGESRVQRPAPAL